MRFVRRLFPKENVSVSPGDFCVVLMELVFGIKEAAAGTLIKAKGTILPTSKLGGLAFEMFGEFTIHPQYGPSFDAHIASPILPNELDGLKAVLGMGLIRGIGPKTAARIVERFKDDTLRILEEEPERLLAIKGINERTIALLRESNWGLSRDLQSAVAFLGEKGLSVTLALRVGKMWRGQTIEIVSKNPYALCAVDGIGFIKADEIAKNMGIEEALDARRIEAGVDFVFVEIANEGHLCYSHRSMVLRAMKILRVGNIAGAEGVVVTVINKMIRDQKIKSLALGDKLFLYSIAGFEAETKTAEILLSLLKKETTSNNVVHAGPLVEDKCEEMSVCLAPEQQRAIESALEHKISIITGGPGTGKTTVLKVLLAAYNGDDDKEHRKELHLMAPTGRAARRMTESTGISATTIHGALGLRINDDGSDQDLVKLDGMVVVDEMSMVDSYLMFKLVSSLQPTARLVMVGDVDQLPSVGPGAVLKSLIESGVVPVTRLTKTFRQSGGSIIITNAMRINQGDACLEEKIGEYRSVYVTSEEQQATVIREYQENVLKYGQSQTVLLTPLRVRGELSSNTLNAKLQKLMNPARADKNELLLRKKGKDVKNAQDEDSVIREGDPVMAKKNFSHMDISNGDVGRVEEVSGRVVRVYFDAERTYDISGEDLSALDLAYASTVHKSQGSEYACVIMVCSSAHTFMLKRNLLYTGVTRAKNECIVVGDKVAVAHAIRTLDASRRGTFLSVLLQKKS